MMSQCVSSKDSVCQMRWWEKSRVRPCCKFKYSLNKCIRQKITFDQYDCSKFVSSFRPPCLKFPIIFLFACILLPCVPLCILALWQKIQTFVIQCGSISSVSEIHHSFNNSSGECFINLVCTYLAILNFLHRFGGLYKLCCINTLDGLNSFLDALFLVLEV